MAASQFPTSFDPLSPAHPVDGLARGRTQDARPRVLVVEDESSLRSGLLRALDRGGYQVVTASTKREAEALGGTDVPLDFALIDVQLPDGDGLDLMKHLSQLHPQLQTVILTGHASIEMAVAATRLGAIHFLAKPFSIDELMSIVDRANHRKKAAPESLSGRAALAKKYHFEAIIGSSPEIKAVLHLVERVADSDSTVLITGESGTGKELIAKAIHYNSVRATKPFVPVNCGAIPSELLESELFGHVKGAFTGAIAHRLGRFDLANGGTLFLDEIAELPLNLQVKILRALQERRFEPVGSTKTHEVDVRVVAATNVDLAKAVQRAQFREDLYYRLDVIPIRLPSLRDRRSDIPILLNHFVTHFSKAKGRGLKGFSAGALEALSSYAWPGNIRELENLVERLTVVKGEGVIDWSDLPEHYRAALPSKSIGGMEGVVLPEQGMDFNSAVDAYENSLILQALEKTGWNRNQAAALLKLNRTTLVEKIKKKGLRPPDSDRELLV